VIVQAYLRVARVTFELFLDIEGDHIHGGVTQDTNDHDFRARRHVLNGRRIATTSLYACSWNKEQAKEKDRPYQIVYVGLA
jgi:hypothetical protein